MEVPKGRVRIPRYLCLLHTKVMNPGLPSRKWAIYFLEQLHSGFWDTRHKGEAEVLSCKQVFGFKGAGSWRNIPGRSLEVWEK